MGRGQKQPIPWDIFVFLSITSLGFVLSVFKIVQAEADSPKPVFESTVNRTTSSLPKNHSTVLDLGCVSKTSTIAKVFSNQGAAQLKGKLCHLHGKKIKHLEGITIRNISNGYEGTVFFQGASNDFTSDFLVLQSGKNVIQVEWKEDYSDKPSRMTAEIIESAQLSQ